jgi:hypothetical protein
MPLLEYQPQAPSVAAPRSLKSRLIASTLIGVGGGVLNFVVLAAGIAGFVLPLAVVGGPSLLGAVILYDHFHFPRSQELARLMLVGAAAAEYAAYGLLLHFPFPKRRLVLLLTLAFHLGSGLVVLLWYVH